MTRDVNMLYYLVHRWYECDVIDGNGIGVRNVVCHTLSSSDSSGHSWCTKDVNML